MKNEVSSVLKRMLAALSAMTKSKSLALRRKTDALRTRLIIFSLLHHDKKFFVSTLSHKLQNLLSHHRHPQHHNHDGDEPREEVEDADVVAEQLTENAIISYCERKALVHEPMPVPAHCEPAKDEEEQEEDDDDHGEDDEKYPDLRHTLFDSSSGGSVIELVKSSKEDRGEEFVLENEIDHVADLFIRRFHRQMRLQKMESFKNYQEMLRRSV